MIHARPGPRRDGRNVRAGPRVRVRLLRRLACTLFLALGACVRVRAPALVPAPAAGVPDRGMCR